MRIYRFYGTDELPFPARWPLLIGCLVGVLLRFVFSDEDGSFLTPMSGTFVICGPIVVGAVTAFCAERIQRRSWWSYASFGAAGAQFFIVGTMLVLLEGLICAVMILPLFSVLGATGGLLMGWACRASGWPKHTINAVALLPLALAFVDVGTPLPVTIRQVDESVLIDAPTATIWQQVHDIRDIKPGELDQAWAFRIGVPTPRSGISTTLDVPVRRVTMGKQVYFDQVVDESRDNEFVRWHYRFYPDSFPPRALDDHVRIGGRYFDLIDTSYSLHPEGNRIRLTLQAHYRVSTRFNWYAGPLSQWLMDNAAGAYLNMYKHRAEATAH